eukprot:gene5227-9379_t
MSTVRALHVAEVFEYQRLVAAAEGAGPDAAKRRGTWVDAWRVDADGAATPEGWWYRANDTHDSSSSRRRLAAPWSRSLLALSSSFAATTTAATVTSGDGADNEAVVAASVGAVRRRRWIRRSKKEATEVKLERPMNRMRMALLANQGSSPSSGGGGGGGGAVGIATPSTFSPPAVPQRLAGQQLPTTSMSSAGAATLGSGGVEAAGSNGSAVPRMGSVGSIDLDSPVSSRDLDDGTAGDGSSVGSSSVAAVPSVDEAWQENGAVLQAGSNGEVVAPITPKTGRRTADGNAAAAAAGARAGNNILEASLDADIAATDEEYIVVTPPDSAQTRKDHWFVGARVAGAWLVDSGGRLLGGYTRRAEIRWRRDFLGAGAKPRQVACTPSGNTWAVDKEGRVYMRSSDTVRSSSVGGVREEVICSCWENQRWWRGYNASMLPTDRPNWSNSVGRKEVKRESFKLPSDRWEWDGEWDVVKGDHTDDEGWQYALDFPRAYNPVPRFSDAVRRRQWKRTRRLNPHSAEWTLVRGMGAAAHFRIGIDDSDPEGHDWVDVPAPSTSTSSSWVGLLDVAGHVSVNNLDRVWLLTPSGQAYFRKNASDQNPIGTAWQAIKGPPLRSISAGKEAVWAVRHDSSVVVRKGITKARPAGKDWEAVSSPPTAPRCIGVNDVGNEVWCVCSGGTVQKRVGVAPASPTGDGWVPVVMPAGARMQISFLTVSGVLPIEQVVNPPLQPGPWSDAILAQLQERDMVERNSRRFGHFETYTDAIPKIDKNNGNDVAHIDESAAASATVAATITAPNSALTRDRVGTGVGRGRTESRVVAAPRNAGGWESVHFVLSSSRKSFAYKTSVSSAARDSVGVGLDASSSSSTSGGNSKGSEISLESMTAVYAEPSEDDLDPECLWCQFVVEFGETRFLLAAETRREKNGWILSLLTAHAGLPVDKRGHVAVSQPRNAPSAQAVWGLDEDGLPWYCERSSLDDTDGEILIWYSLQPYSMDRSWGGGLGRFVDIAAGSGVVWGVGEDNQVYVYTPTLPSSNDDTSISTTATTATTSGTSTNNTAKVGMSSEPDCWTKILPYIDNKTGQLHAFSFVTLGSGVAWACTQSGTILVRWNVHRDTPTGSHWQPLPGDDGFKRVIVCGESVWGITQAGYLVTRHGFSSENPCGTHWTLSNGIILSDFNLGGSAMTINDDIGAGGSRVSESESNSGPAAVGEPLVVLDLSGTTASASMVDATNRLHFGRANVRGCLEWGVETGPEVEAVWYAAGEQWWCMTSAGDVAVCEASDQIQGPVWTTIASVCAHDPSRTMKWKRCIGTRTVATTAADAAAASSAAAPSGSGSSSPPLLEHAKGSSSGSSGNGIMVAPRLPPALLSHNEGSVSSVASVQWANGKSAPAECAKSTWAAAFRTLLVERDASLAGCLAAHPWETYADTLAVGTPVVAWFSNDSDCWFCGRCVGTRGFDGNPGGADLYLVRFENHLHLWTLKSSLVIDEPPHAGVLCAGLHVLFSLSGWRGDVRFVPGQIVEVNRDARGFPVYKCRRTEAAHIDPVVGGGEVGQGGAGTGLQGSRTAAAGGSRDRSRSRSSNASNGAAGEADDVADNDNDGGDEVLHERAHVNLRLLPQSALFGT